MDGPLGGNEVRGERVPRGRWLSRRPTLGEAAYLLAVATIATRGFVTGSTALILLAALLALPTSVPALIGYYLAFGLVAQLPGANPSSSSGSGSCSPSGECHLSVTGDPAAWFTLTTDVIGILALTGAAMLNVALLRSLRTARRAPMQVSAPRDR